MNTLVAGAGDSESSGAGRAERRSGSCFTAPAFPGSAYIPAIFGTAVYLYGDWVFLAGGVRELRDRLPGMMTLISLAISVAFVFSLAVRTVPTE